MREHSITQVNLYPGFNFVPQADWQAVRPGMESRIGKSEVVEWPDGIASARDSVVRAAVRETGAVKVLRRLLDMTGSDAVAAAIEKQIHDAQHGGPGTRRAPAAHAQA